MGINNSFLDRTGEVLDIAQKLRNPELFRERFIYEVGKCGPQSEIRNREVLRLVVKEHKTVCDKVMAAQKNLLDGESSFLCHFGFDYKSGGDPHTFLASLKHAQVPGVKKCPRIYLFLL